MSNNILEPGQSINLLPPYHGVMLIDKIDGLPRGVTVSPTLPHTFTENEALWLTASETPAYGTFTLTVTSQEVTDDPRPPHFKGKWPPPPGPATPSSYQIIVRPASGEFSLSVEPTSLEFWTGQPTDATVRMTITRTGSVKNPITAEISPKGLQPWFSITVNGAEIDASRGTVNSPIDGVLDVRLVVTPLVPAAQLSDRISGTIQFAAVGNVAVPPNTNNETKSVDVTWVVFGVT